MHTRLRIFMLCLVVLVFQFVICAPPLAAMSEESDDEVEAVVEDPTNAGDIKQAATSPSSGSSNSESQPVNVAGSNKGRPKEALLIANSDYSNFPKLGSPKTDALVLGDSLRKLGFATRLVENASREQMLDEIKAFEDRLKNTRGIAFFHFGGHGVQVDGTNYLIPADADIPDERRVSTRAVQLNEVMGALDASGSEVNIVVLDACRDNPLPASGTRSATRGLAVVGSKPKNSIVIYAAEAGSKANDGLFTPVLARELAAQGRSISEIMTRVRKEVNEKSGGTQTPGEYTQLFEQVFLGGSSASTQSGDTTAPTISQTAEAQAPGTHELRQVVPEVEVPRMVPSQGEHFTVAYKGADGVGLRDSPGGRIVATAYHGPDTLLVAVSDTPITTGGLTWVHVKVRGWMAARNLQNGDINIATTQGGGGVVTWDGGGNPNDNFIAMRTLGAKGSRIAKVYHRSKIAIRDTTISGNYEWVQAEVSGWVALRGPRGSLLIEASVPKLPVISPEATSFSEPIWYNAVIQDKDGHTNVRNAPNTSAGVAAVIVDGEVFKVKVTTGDWWQVKTKDGVDGYIHRSRVRITQ